MLRKDKKLNKEFIDDLTNQTAELQNKINNYEKMIGDYQSHMKNIYKKELDNAKIALQILKDFYLDEINYAKGIIQELSMTIDDILLKYSHIYITFSNKMNMNKDPKKRSILMKEFYMEKKDNIIFKDHKAKSINMLADAMITEGGTATKYIFISFNFRKLDFVLIDFNENLKKVNEEKTKDDKENNEDKYEIIFGSGLDRSKTTKCPLYKNLKFGLKGDEDNNDLSMTE
jgi:hypothetical protein